MFLSLVPHLRTFTPEVTPHYASGVELDRVYCSLENSPPVNLSVPPALPDSMEEALSSSQWLSLLIISDRGEV